MIYDRKFWFAPAYALDKAVQWHESRETAGKPLTGPEQQARREVISSAIFLLGISKLSGDFYRLQLVDPAERTPDIRSARAIIGKRGRPEIEYQDLEIVTLEQHSPEEADEFIIRTKLSKKRAYQPDTIILCHIDKTVASAMPWRKVHESLVSATSAPVQVYLLARIAPISRQVYRACMVYPKLANVVEFDVHEEALRALRNGIKGTEVASLRVNAQHLKPYPDGISPFDDAAPSPLGKGPKRASFKPS